MSKLKPIGSEKLKGQEQINRILEIAKYNVGDLIATKTLYEYWEKFVKF